MPALFIIRDLLAAHARIDYAADCLLRARQETQRVAGIYANAPSRGEFDETKSEQILSLAQQIENGPLAASYKLAEEIEGLIKEAAALLDAKPEESSAT